MEAACADNKGWQSLPRGGSLNAPTVADKVLPVSTPTLPPSRRGRRVDVTASSTTESTRKQKSGFLPFLAAILMAAALLAIIAWQVKPAWLGVSNSPPEKTVAQEEPTKTPAPVPAVAPPAVVTPPAESKPSAMPPDAANVPPPIGTKPPEHEPTTAVVAKSEPRPDSPVRRAPPSRESQPIQVVTSPGGAIVTLDGDMDSACTTPARCRRHRGHHVTGHCVNPASTWSAAT